MIKRFLKIVATVVFILAILGFWSYANMDGFKELKPLALNNCSTITGPAAAEDMVVDRETGLAYLSVLDRMAVVRGEVKSPGQIVVLDLNSNPVGYDWGESGVPTDFYPHGISLVNTIEGKFLFVINHRADGRETIERFSVDGARLIYLETLSHTAITHPNDLVAVGPRKFYVGNDSGASNAFEKLQEMVFGVGYSTIVYMDGENGRVAVEGFPSSSGINASLDGKFVYISGTSSRQLRSYRRDIATGDLTPIENIATGMGTDNIDVDSEGTVWVAGHPKVIDLIKHFASGGVKTAPSQIMRLSPDATGLLESAERVYTSMGDDIGASSVAVNYAGKLYIGSITSPFILTCDTP
ncbi:MAG: SMP-30/gluconolactonase/LRE family protein [Pseudomonadales bacterium]